MYIRWKTDRKRYIEHIKVPPRIISNIFINLTERMIKHRRFIFIFSFIQANILDT